MSCSEIKLRLTSSRCLPAIKLPFLPASLFRRKMLKEILCLKCTVECRVFSLPYSYVTEHLTGLPSVWWAGSSVGIATVLRAGRSGIESRWGRDFPPVHTGPGAHPASCKMGTGSFPGVKCGRGVLLTTHPLLVPRSWKSRAIPLPTLRTTPGL